MRRLSIRVFCDGAGCDRSARVSLDDPSDAQAILRQIARDTPGWSSVAATAWDRRKDYCPKCTLRWPDCEDAGSVA